MKLTDLLALAQNDKLHAPAPDQLHRLAAFAMLAWDDEHEIQYGFSYVKDGIRIYVKQKRRGGNQLAQEGSDTEELFAQMESHLGRVASDRMSLDVAQIIVLVNGAVRP